MALLNKCDCQSCVTVVYKCVILRRTCVTVLDEQ